MQQEAQDNQPGQTREVNGRRTPRLAVGRQEAEEEGYFYQAVECVFDQIFSFGLYVIRYMLCFYVFGCNLGQNKQSNFLAYVMLISCVFMFLCFQECCWSILGPF